MRGSEFRFQVSAKLVASARQRHRIHSLAFIHWMLIHRWNEPCAPTLLT